MHTLPLAFDLQTQDPPLDVPKLKKDQSLDAVIDVELAKCRKQYAALARVIQQGLGEMVAAVLPDVVAFLELFLTQRAEVLFKAMKQAARLQFQTFFDSDPKPRMLTRFHSLELPAPQNDTWSLTLDDGTPFGPVVVIEMHGWTIEKSTLVG